TLSTLTASSLILESSPYSSPEQVGATAIDLRSDLFAFGVILWRALTGTLPFGEQPAFLRERTALPALAVLRPGIPSAVAALVRRCLADDPQARPPSAREVAEVLRGERALGELATLRVMCQACGKPLRAGLRLCLSCGKAPVQFRYAATPDDQASLELVKVS